MEAEKRHQQQLQRLTVDHEEEMRVLQLAHQLNMKGVQLAVNHSKLLLCHYFLCEHVLPLVGQWLCRDVERWRIETF